MWQAVTVGGAIVVEDADFEGSFCDPPNPGFAFWVDAYKRVLERHGGDPQLGRKLHRLFPAAGIPEPAITLAQRTDSTGENKTLPYSTVSATAEAIVHEGIATAEELKRRWRISPTSPRTLPRCAGRRGCSRHGRGVTATDESGISLG